MEKPPVRYLSGLERILPYLMALVFAGVGVLINAALNRGANPVNHLLEWAIFMGMLLVIWHLNQFFGKRINTSTVLMNLGLVAGMAFIYNRLFYYPAPYVTYIRLVMPTLLFVTIQQTFHTWRRNESLLVENLQLRAENYKAELENLKKQLNPHFLFNSLSTLQAIIRSDPEHAEKYVIRLSDLYRSILQKSSQEKISLKEEIAIVEAYIYLQQTRFEEALKFEISLLPGSEKYQLPAFALQLLVENCIKHNILSREKPLHIRIEQRDLVTVTVTNNLQVKKQSVESPGIGLANLSKRYELLGIPSGIEISSDDKTYSVTLKLF